MKKLISIVIFLSLLIPTLKAQDVDADTLYLNNKIIYKSATWLNDSLDMNSKRIKDLMAGLDLTDAITLGQLVDSIGAFTGPDSLSKVDFYRDIGRFAHREARLFYDTLRNRLSYYNDIQHSIKFLGYSTFIEAVNNSGSQILRGRAVYIDSASNQLPEIELATNESYDASRIIGVVSDTVENGATMDVMFFGVMDSLNTSAYSIADILYLDNNGFLTNTKPIGGKFPNRVGFVTVVHATTGEIIVYPNSVEETAEMVRKTGFPYQAADSSDISFNNSNRYFKIQPVVTEFYYYNEGTKYIFDTADSVQITDVEGVHLIYYDEDVLTVCVNPTKAEAKAIILPQTAVSVIYWDATNNEEIYFGDERHFFGMPSITHWYLHEVFGAQFLDGLALTDILADQSGALDSHAQFGIDAGNITDEDYQINLDVIGSTTGTQVYWRSGASGDWRVSENLPFSVLVTGTGRLAWNEFTGGVWQQTEVTNGSFVLAHVFATNKIADKTITVMGQAEYSSVAGARVGANEELDILQTGSFPFEEAVPIATVIFETKNVYTNRVKALIRTTDTGADYVDWRFQNLITGSGGGAASTTFLALLDVPNSYAGEGDKIVQVNNAESGLEFADTINLDGGATFGSNVDITGILDADSIISDGGATFADTVTMAKELHVTGNVGIGTANPDATLDVEGDMIITPTSGTQDYLFTDLALGGALYLEGQTSGDGSALFLAPKDGDGTDEVSFQIIALRNAGFSVRSRLITGWDPAGYFEIQSESSSAGNLSPIKIFTEGNTDQLLLAIDGTASFSGDSVLGTNTSIPYDATWNGSLGFPPKKDLFAKFESIASSIYWSRTNGTITPTTATDTLYIPVYIGVGTDTPSFTAGEKGVHIHAAGTGGANSSKLRFTTGDTGVTSSDGMDLGYDASNIAYMYNRENTSIIFGTNNTLALTLEADQDGLFAADLTITDQLAVNTTINPNYIGELHVDDTDNKGGLLIDQNDTGAYYGIEVNSESTTREAIYAHGKFAAAFEQDLADGSGLYVRRNLAEAGSASLVEFIDEHTSNTQATLTVRQDGSGDIFQLYDGAVKSFYVEDGGNATLTGNLLTATHNTYDIGLTGTRFNHIYGDSIHATWFGGSDIEMSEVGSKITINADSTLVTSSAFGNDWLNSDKLVNAGVLFNKFTTLSALDFWSQTGNYVYPKTIGDSVGVGTNSPTEKFHVNGSSLLSGTTTVDANLYLTSTATNHLRLPLNNESTSPTLSIGDSNSGFYSGGEDILKAAIGGNVGWTLDAQTFTIEGDSILIPNAGQAYGNSWKGSDKLVNASTLHDKFESLAGGGTVTSVGFGDGTGFTISGSPITTSGSFTFGLDFSEFTDITESTGIKFVVTDPAEKEIAIGNVDLSDFNNDANFSTTVGTVTSVGGTGTVNGLTLTGTVTASGNLTLGGTLAISNSDWSGTDLSLTNGGTGASLADPGADRILFWDDSETTAEWLTLGTNLSITGTTINAIGGGAGTVTSVVAGDGLDFSTFTVTGSVTMGTPSSSTSSSTNAVTATSHTHELDNVAFTNVANSFLQDQLITDNDKLLIGTGGKMEILYSSGTTINQINLITGNLEFTGAAGKSIGFGLDCAWDDGEQILLGDAGDLVIQHDGTNSSINNTTGELLLQGIPTSDPVLANAIWNSSGTLMLSTGAQPIPRPEPTPLPQSSLMQMQDEIDLLKTENAYLTRAIEDLKLTLETFMQQNKNKN